MKTVLVISSYVSASQVGGIVSSFCLSRRNIHPVLLPTTILGRHPGWGAPGGGAVAVERFKDIWAAIAEQDLAFDAILTGYIADPAQVEQTAAIIDQVSSHHDNVRILVDPVMGDHGRLYVGRDTAKAIIEHLVPRGHILTPNRFELAEIFGRSVSSAQDVIELTAGTDQDWLVTSLGEEERTGAVFAGPDFSAKIRHERFETVPNGCGDALAALYLAHILSDEAQSDAFLKSVSSVFGLLNFANETGSRELPIYRAQHMFDAEPALTLSPI